MLAAPLDVFGLIVRYKCIAYRLSATCKQLRAQIRGIYSLQKTGACRITMTGQHREWVYHEVDGIFWTPVWKKYTDLENIIFGHSHARASCSGWPGPPFIYFNGAHAYPHELAFAIRGDKITAFDAIHTSDFIHAAQYYGVVYKFVRVEYSNNDPGGMYLGMDNRICLNVRGGDRWKIVLERVYMW